MVNVIGLGYIGLPTALMMATHGVEVVGTDYNEELVATLNAGHTTFKEEGLDELFADALKSGIKFTTEYQVCDTYIVSVPTPYDKLDKKIDPSSIKFYDQSYALFNSLHWTSSQSLICRSSVIVTAVCMLLFYFH